MAANTEIPTYRTIDLRGVCQRIDPEIDKPDTAYQFSNGREFKSTDDSENGVYRRT